MIYKFTPVLRPMIWGSELWVLSGYDERPTRVSGGPYDGLTLNELVALRGEALMGSRALKRYGCEFPLLIKFIDAHDDLSIQVHPDEELAQKRCGGHGKTEMWYIISAERDAHLFSGLKAPLTPGRYAEMVSDNSITDALASHCVRPGDVFFIPAGRIHAICSGIYLAEIQQTSDITYRIYDYGRPGPDGKPRQLHTELAKDAIDYKVYPEYRSSCPVDCEYFHTDLVPVGESLPDGAPGREFDLSGLDTCIAFVCVEGAGAVDGTPIRAGEVALVDATAASVRLTGRMKLLSTHV